MVGRDRAAKGKNRGAGGLRCVAARLLDSATPVLDDHSAIGLHLRFS
jgi:hypothetical protein